MVNDILTYMVKKSSVIVVTVGDYEYDEFDVGYNANQE